MDSVKSIGSIPATEVPAQVCWWSRVGGLTLAVQFFVWEELIRHHFPEQAIGHPGHTAPFPLGFFLGLEPANLSWSWGTMLTVSALTVGSAWKSRRSNWVLGLNVALMLFTLVVIHQMTGFLAGC